MPDIPVLEVGISIYLSDRKTFLKHLISGAISAAISRTITAPLDRLKTFRQVDNKFRPFWQILRDMKNEGGITSMWRGNLMNVVKNSPKQAVRFAVYNEMKLFIQNDPFVPLTLNQRFTAGCVAGLIGQVTTYPLDMLKVRLNLRTTGRYNSIFDAIKKIYQCEGIRSFGRGFIPSVLAIMPYTGFDLAGYETLKEHRTRYTSRSLNKSEQFLFGSLSCALAQFITYPVMLVAVKMQASESDLKKKRNSMTFLLLKIWREEGIPGLYRGMYVNMLKFIPAMGITYVLYEHVNRLLKITMAGN